MTEFTMQELLTLRNRVLRGEADDLERARFASRAGALDHRPSVGLLHDLLEDEDEIVRHNALTSLVLRLSQRTPQMAQVCWRLLREDPDDDVRRLALSCLGSISWDSGDLETFEWVRKGLEERRFEPHMLETAYSVLFEIAGRPPDEWPFRMEEDFMPYEEIDWEKVAEMEAEVREKARRETGG